MLRTLERSVQFAWDKVEHVGVDMGFRKMYGFAHVLSIFLKLEFRALCHSWPSFLGSLTSLTGTHRKTKPLSKGGFFMDVRSWT